MENEEDGQMENEYVKKLELEEKNINHLLDGPEFVLDHCT